MTRSTWTIGWLVLLAAVVTWEIAAALASGQPGPQTWSEHVWMWFAFPGGWMLLLGGLGYLTWHLVHGARRKR